MTKLSIKPLFNKRIIVYLIILLILQCLIAYSALVVFDALPQSITGIPEDHLVQRDSQRGAVNLIRMQINQHKEIPIQQVIDNLQPYFGYPLHVVSIDTTLAPEVKKEFDQYDYAYDEVQDILYANLNNGYMLVLGPILMRDILESDIMSFGLFLLLWSLFSAAIFFLLIYFAFAQFWKDLINIRQTAEQLSQGNLKARAESARSWLFKPLANILNNMGTHIEHLVTTSQTISHAMAHELRTPLARMRFGLSMFYEASNEQEKLELCKGMDDDINELESLINASLSYFKMQQNKIELNLSEVSLSQWSNKLCNSLKLFKPKNFELICKAEDTLALIDVQLADTIVTNLLMNAFKYATNKTVLNITKKEDLIVIEVDDNGPGIPINARDKVFMPFSRLDNSRTRTTGGYGLGLAYVKLMAEFHYGSAFVVTSSLGGARFIVTLQSGE